MQTTFRGKPVEIDEQVIEHIKYLESALQDASKANANLMIENMKLQGKANRTQLTTKQLWLVMVLVCLVAIFAAIFAKAVIMCLPLCAALGFCMYKANQS